MTPRVVALAALLVPGVGWDRSRRRSPGERRLGPGMVLDGDGGWRPPTPTDTLGALRGDPAWLMYPGSLMRFTVADER